jgi:hypothetical protein
MDYKPFINKAESVMGMYNEGLISEKEMFQNLLVVCADALEIETSADALVNDSIGSAVPTTAEGWENLLPLKEEPECPKCPAAKAAGVQCECGQPKAYDKWGKSRPIR